MVTYIPQFMADSSSGIGALGVDVKALVIQLVTFMLAFLILKRFAFGPIAKIMEKRRETIDAGVLLGEQMQKQQAQAQEKVAAELRAARQKADGIVAEAQDAARATVHDAEDKARAKGDGIIKDAEAKAAQEVQRARKQLEGELVGLISDATEAIIGEKVDAKKDAQLIDRALKEQNA